jgi:hypothetical protein
MNYDIIGDIHGCANTLAALLEKLGYVNSGGCYSHPSRQAIFLGDFIDRGPHQRGVIDIVRPMVEQGAALSVMGNHEFNAIAYFTPAPEGDYLRPRTERNSRQHKAFLDAYSHDQDAWEDVIGWFKTLPLWLDLEDIRVVHACWDPLFIELIKEEENGGNRLSEELLYRACEKGSLPYQAIETLLKGKEVKLPEGNQYTEKDGTQGHHIRVRWWDQEVTTYKDAYMGPESAITHIPEDPLNVDHLIIYSHTEKPVFLGHYWMEGEPVPLAPNIACLDYSIAKPGGKLVAYRWDGGTELSADNFVAVERIENEG